MEFTEFKNKFFNEVKNESGFSLFKKQDSIVSIIEKNKKIVSEYLNGEKRIDNINEFVNDLNNVILEINNYNKIEKSLKHSLFTLVNVEFKKSDVLIRACKAGNKKLAKWLLEMDVNPYVTDNYGRTALMYAVQQMLFDSVVKELIKVGEGYVTMKDNDGNTALFHAVGHSEYIEKLIKAGSDIKHINKNGDTILHYSCKQEKFVDFEELLDKEIDLTHINNDCKNVAMMLIEKIRPKLLRIVLNKNSSIVNYRNKFGETLVTVYIKQYYQQVIAKEKPSQPDIVDFTTILRILVYKKCNFNVSIDDNGNTPVHFFLNVEDYHSLLFLLNYNNNIDISVRNNDGVNASFLRFFVNPEIVEDYTSIEKKALKYNNNSSQHMNIISAMYANDTFDYSFLDMYNNNLLIHNIVRGTEITTYNRLIDNSKINGHCNDKGENALIIAIKLGNKIGILKPILKYTGIDVNHVDNTGNSALHYAVRMKNKGVITLLMENNADPQIKANDGVTAMDLAKSINDPDIIDLLENPLQEKRKNIIEKIKDSLKGNDGFTEEDKFIYERYIKQYKKEYKHLINYEIPRRYSPSPKNKIIRPWVFKTLYEEAIETVEAKEAFEAKRRRRRRERLYGSNDN